ncbi:MAG TPA: hypothetical protein VE822_12230 [Candidatus Elarobacter sp.]|nr:hypothetical protein [Candidatus Elarobacter sp.]
MRPTLRILPCVAFVFAGVLGGAATQSAKKGTDVSKGTVYACALLTPAEIEAIQGERVEETKPTVRPSGGLFATQCLFRTPTLNKSVSLFLIASDPLHPVPLTARQLWQKQFHSSEVDEEPVAGENKKKLDPQRERESREPRPIRGLGEEAYWVASPVASALYVLKGEMFLRISVGSAGQESERMEKSKALARAVLKRL